MSDKQRNALLQAQAWLERQAAIASGQADDIPDEGYADMFNAVLALVEDALEEPTGWQPIEVHPEKPMTVFFYSTTAIWFDQAGVEHGKNGGPCFEEQPYRDERYEVGYWNGFAFCYLGTGHEVFEFPHDEDDPRKPTHWMRASPPTPQGEG